MRTSATVVLVDGSVSGTFLHLPGANGALRAKELDRELLFSGRALHVAGSLVMPALDAEPTAAILGEARGRGLLTSLDTVFDATGRWERLSPCLPLLDLFTPGLAEARALRGGRAAADRAALLREQGVGEVALTMGAQGATPPAGDFEGFVEPVPVRAVDDAGSGDVRRRPPVREAGRLAVSSARLASRTRSGRCFAPRAGLDGKTAVRFRGLSVDVWRTSTRRRIPRTQGCGSPACAGPPPCSPTACRGTS